MNTFKNLVAMFCLSGMFSPAFAVAQWPALDGLPTVTKDAAIPGKYIVVMKQGKSPLDALKEHRINAKNIFDGVQGFSASMSAAQVDILRHDPDVAIVEPDYVVTAFAQSNPTGIQRIGALTHPVAKINGIDERVDVDVAIIDTGIDLDHPDLNVVANKNLINASQTGDDDNGHGSHVAGTVAALDNDIGVVGVAPGARLWAVKVLDAQGSGAMSTIIAGIDYVTTNAAQIDVANMSLGCECTSAALNEAIKRSVQAGVVYVVAAGNSAKDAKNYSPANHPDVITVSAIADFNGQAGGGASATCRSDVDDTLADFSNFGAVVEIAAPGVCINSTYKNGGYAVLSGTSMASPHVTGAAALYVAINGKPANATGVVAVRSALIAQAVPQNSPTGFTGDKDSNAEPLLALGTASTSSASSASSVSSVTPVSSSKSSSSSSRSSSRFRWPFPWGSGR